MSEVVVRLLGLVRGDDTSLDGQWLVEYDPTRPGHGPEGEPMTAHVTVSPYKAAARRFPDAAAALTYIRQDSGRPHPSDRPLTAYHLMLELEDAPDV